MPVAFEVTVRGWSNGRGGGEENSSPGLNGFWVREREEVVDPFRVCVDLSAELPLRCLLVLCRRWMAGLVVDGLGEKGNWVAILCELDGNECGVAML